MVDASNRSSVQPPNHITDISSYLTLGQDFKDLARYIDDLNRTLTDNERALRITLKGLIDTFDDVNKEYQKTGKLTDEQARNLKVLLSNERMVIGWLKQLSSSKGGVGRNSRGDKSPEEYSKFLKTITSKRDSAMERVYKSTASIEKNVATSVKKGGKGGSILNSNFFNNLNKALNSVPFVGSATRGLAVMSRSYRAGADALGSKEFGSLRGWMATKESGFDNKINHYNALNYLRKSTQNAGSQLSSQFKGYISPRLANYPNIGGSSISNPGIGKTITRGLGKTTAMIGKGVFKIAGAATMALPIIGAILTGVGFIMKELRKHSPVLDAVLSIFELAYSLIFMPIGNMLGEYLLPLAETMIEFAIAFNTLFSDFSFTSLLDVTMRLGEVLTAALQTIWNMLFDLLWSLSSFIPDLIFSLIMDGLEALFRACGLNDVADNIKTFKDKFLSLRDTIVSWIRALPSILAGLPNVLLAGLKSLLSGGDFVEGVKNRWNETIGNWTGVRLATGGVVTSPTIAMVGEAGPEAVVPLDRANGIGATYVINLNGDVYGVSDLESRIERVIQRTANKSYYR